MSEAEAYVVFFDTSALVKRYHREVGSDVVEAAFSDPGLTRMISDLGVIECYSAFARRVRIGDISEEDFHATIKELAEDIQNGTIQLGFFGDSDKKEAAVLIEKYGLSRNLRTLDAMQLAVMKSLRAQVIRDVYCADHPFVDLIAAEGFSVINPEASQETRQDRLTQ
jgi:predicted nucleic acid-binding protein